MSSLSALSRRLGAGGFGYALRAITLFGTYVVLGHLGLKMNAVAGFATLVWPPTGLALAALLGWGLRLWPVVTAGAFVVNLWQGAPALVASGIAAGNTIEAVVAAIVLRRVDGGSLRLDRLRFVVWLVTFAALVTTALSASIGVGSLFLGGIVEAAQIDDAWLAWWVGDAVSDLVQAPLLLAWLGTPFELPRSRRRWLELLALAALTLGIAASVFVPGERPVLRPYMLFVPLLWGALRFGPKGATASTSVVAVFAVWGAFHGYDEFRETSLVASLLTLQTYMVFVAATALLIAAIAAERTSAEQATRQGAARLRLAQQAARIGTFEWRASTGVCYFTPELEAMYGLPPGGFAGSLSAWEQLVDPKDRPTFTARVQQALATGELTEGEWRVVWPDESVHWLAGRWQAFTDEAGRPVLLTGVNVDITDRRRAEEALREANARLTEVDCRRTEFLAMLSHELRNPLAPIRNSLYILHRAAPGGEQARRALDTIERQVGHLIRLIEDLLEVTRMTRGKIDLQRERLNLNELAQRTVEDHRTVFAANGVRLDFSPAATAVWVNGDRTRLAQVIGNLLQNAAKFTPRGGSATVTVETDAVQGEAVLMVSDTGRGIAPEVLPHLFNTFAQADTTLDRSKGGLGLGLALAKGLVELHQGMISGASPGLGKGATFTVRLPLDRSTADAIRATQRPSHSDEGHLRVLIVEDNVDAAESLREVLVLLGHEVAVAHDGPEGVQMARELRPDVVLCDIGLPGMDGYALALALRADSTLRSTYLVALTGYAQPGDVVKAREAGFDRHLAKPIALEALEQMLATVSPS